MLGTWAKHGAAEMGGAGMKLHGSIQGVLLVYDSCLWLLGDI